MDERKAMESDEKQPTDNGLPIQIPSREEADMFKTIHIKKHERGLWFRRGDFERLLYPGTYRFWELPWNFGSTKIETIDLLKARFEHPMLDLLIDDERLRESLILIDLTDDER